MIYRSASSLVWNMAGNDLTPIMRGYLAEVYRLNDRSPETDGFVTTSELAELLFVSAPAVNRMVTKLKDLGLVEHEPYQGISLTEAGKREALIKLRNHRIAEAFLVNVMDFGWHEVYEEADRISGSIGKQLADRMLEMANNPQFCPHGEPIPHEDNTIEAMNDQLLTQVEVGKSYRITRVLTREPDRLEYIAALGLKPGATFELIHIAPFEGPMQLKLDHEYRIIGHSLAALIRVCPE